MAAFVPVAHPYRDLDIIDERAPRFNQAIVGSVALVAVVTGWWGLLALLSVQLVLGLTLGRRWCIQCLVYFELVQPRFGEGKLEDSRPPRFANRIGAAVTGGAAVAYAAGLPLLGAVLGLLVAALALLAAATGFCMGCEIYRLSARLRGVGARSGRISRIDPTDLDVSLAGETVVEFTHPLCSDCHQLAHRLRDAGRTVVTVDVRSRPDLAEKYGVGVVPTAVTVDPAGAVVGRLA